jgi:microcystin-dependent protein
MSTPYLGEIRLFAFPRIPSGWFACDGSFKPIAEYEALYTLLGTTFGGDGINTFAVPDLRGRLPIDMGRGAGLTPRALGESSGTENVTLLSPNLPSHSHTFMATTSLGTTNALSSSVELGTVSGDLMYAKDLTGAHAYGMSPTAISATGGNLPHDNTMPTLTASFCIAWAGIYPSQG